MPDSLRKYFPFQFLQAGFDRKIYKPSINYNFETMKSTLQDMIERERQKIKRFFVLSEIPFSEDTNHLRIKGKAISVSLIPFPEITVEVDKETYLTVKERKGKIVLYYSKEFNEQNFKEIWKSDLYLAIYYFNNELVFLF